jgi:hypothetical protein
MVASLVEYHARRKASERATHRLRHPMSDRRIASERATRVRAVTRGVTPIGDDLP